MPFKKLNNPEHWRDRAIEALMLAELTAGTPLERAMHDLAGDYATLADRAEERTKRLGRPRMMSPGRRVRSLRGIPLTTAKAASHARRTA
jgi:hypothetical protein